MWWKIVLFVIAVATALWAECNVMDDFVAQHPELDEEEENHHE